MSNTDGSQKQGIWALLLAISVVTTMGVSTAQVMNTLAEKPVSPLARAATAFDEPSADLSVTLITVRDSGSDTLVLRNIQDTDLLITHIDKKFFSLKGLDEDCVTECDVDPIALKPDQQVSLLIDTEHIAGARSGSGVVSMKGYVIDGRVVLSAD